MTPSTDTDTGTGTGEINTFMIADIRGYTSFTQERGDEAAAGLAGYFAENCRKVVEEHSGRLVELRGDEALCLFGSARQAIIAAVDLQDRFVREAVADPDRPLLVGIGLDVGEAVPVENGYRGSALNVAARLCSLAAPGEVLASQTVTHLAGRLDDVGYEPRGATLLKGISDPVQVVRVSGAGDPMGRLAGAKTVKTMTVALADDSILLREGVARLLTESGFRVTVQAGDAGALLAAVRADPPDIAILDIRMPPTFTNEGLRAAHQIREELPDVGVLLLSQYVETDSAIDLVSAGAGHLGYLLKDRVVKVQEFTDAVRRVAAGGSVIDPEVVSRLVGRARRDNPIDALTDREREVLSLMAEGRSNQAIAEHLSLSAKSIEGHVRNIFTKLGLSNTPDDHRRVLAVLTYLKS
ncbi:MAG: LuxR C-terminal-related transcriptional regulator [Nocardioidaceae bacterium]